MKGSITITPLEEVPERLLGVRKEANMLWYGPSQVLLAKHGEDIVGAVRLALCHDPLRSHGLITDLIVDEEQRGQGLEERLIREAQRVLKAEGARKIDALVVDGQGWTSHFYNLGFWPSRKSVVLEWDLKSLSPMESNPDFQVKETDRPDPEPAADLILKSYQPYWRWWKAGKMDRRWFRVEFPATQPRRPQEEEAEVRERIIELLSGFGSLYRERMFIAYRGERAVGLCDARYNPQDDTFEWGPLVLRDFGGRQVGSTLLKPALEWLRDQGLERAQLTTTSGLDDYDPVVYMCVLSSGARIKGEFLDLVKRRL